MAEFVKANGLFESAGRILLAVSGGADSTALLYVICALKDKGVLSSDFVCAHINHQLRDAQADEDEEFVIAQASGLNIPIVTRRVDVRGFANENRLSIETAARRLRIESLMDIAKANDCSWIATGHQKNDNAETVLQRLARGTGLRGLGGIWPMRAFGDNVSFVRPMLCVSREEIVQYLKERNLKWRVDVTNENCRHRRNYIRHRLIPALQSQCSGSVVEQLSELAQSARKFYKLVCERADEIWSEMADCSSNEVRLNLQKFLNQPRPVKVELVRRGLSAVGSGERNLRQGHFEKILQLAEQDISGRKIELPDGFVVLREYGELLFGQGEENHQDDERIIKEVEIEVPGQTRFGDCLIDAVILEAEQARFEKFKAEKTSFVEWFDLEKIALPVVVRFRRDGDRFRPLGLVGQKKVGKFLSDARVPQQLRKKVLIVADSDKIIWIWPIRISEQVKINRGTQKIFQLQISDAYRDISA